jgi:hypothetical protein
MYSTYGEIFPTVLYVRFANRPLEGVQAAGVVTVVVSRSADMAPHISGTAHTIGSQIADTCMHKTLYS